MTYSLTVKASAEHCNCRYQSGERRGGSTVTSPRDGYQYRDQYQGGGAMSSSVSADMTGRPGSRTTSAPTSPLRERPVKRDTFLGKVSALSQVVTQVKESGSYRSHTSSNCYNLLVIDDYNTDWTKYFRNRRIHQDWDIRVYQTEFKDLSVNSGASTGVSVTITSSRSGTKCTE